MNFEKECEVLRVLVISTIYLYLSDELLHAWHVHKTYPKTDDFAVGNEQVIMMIKILITIVFVCIKS